MGNAMVTARMTQAKKDAGNRVLEQLGMNASQMINQAYDYLIERRALPFEAAAPRQTHTAEEIARAKALVAAMRIPKASRFSSMTDDEIRQARLIDRGLVSEGHFA